MLPDILYSAMPGTASTAKSGPAPNVSRAAAENPALDKGFLSPGLPWIPLFSAALSTGLRMLSVFRTTQ